MKVLVIGIGGVGCSTTYLLGGMNVLFDICDNDIIEESNLNRQFFYNMENISEKKVKIAKEKLLLYFPHLINEIECFEDLEKINFKKYKLIVDCTDNIKTRKRISEKCKENNVPLLYVSAQNTIARVGFFKSKYLHECVVEGKEEKQIDCFHCPSAAFCAGSIAANQIIKFTNNEINANEIIIMDLKENKIKKIEI
jgi:molybdopterin/thiamine biosynthesis adenylyltransferase